MWFSVFAVISTTFRVFHDDGASLAPGWETLVKRKAWGGFWRSLYRKVAHFWSNVGIFTHFMKMRENRDISVNS